MTEQVCPLSPRQLTALRAVARAGSYAAAASALGCSRSTVRDHVGASIRRLGLHSVTSAVAYAIERGWIRNVTIDRETKWLLYGGGLDGVGE